VSKAYPARITRGSSLDASRCGCPGAAVITAWAVALPIPSSTGPMGPSPVRRCSQKAIALVRPLFCPGMTTTGQTAPATTRPQNGAGPTSHISKVTDPRTIRGRDEPLTVESGLPGGCGLPISKALSDEHASFLDRPTSALLPRTAVRIFSDDNGRLRKPRWARLQHSHCCLKKNTNARHVMAEWSTPLRPLATTAKRVKKRRRVASAPAEKHSE